MVYDCGAVGLLTLSADDERLSGRVESGRDTRAVQKVNIAFAKEHFL